MATHGNYAASLSKAANVKSANKSVRASAKQAGKVREKIRNVTSGNKATTLGNDVRAGYNDQQDADLPFDVRRAHRAKWTAGSKNDDEMAARQQLLSDGQAQGVQGPGATPFGLLTVDGKKAVKYLTEKKEQSQYLKSLRLAEQLIDPKNPATQDHAYAVYPELLTRPQQQHLEDIAIQESLRQMLIHGRIDGQKDNETILRVLHPDFELPTSALWDSVGLTLKLADQEGRIDALRAGIFSPRQWGWTKEQSQMALKVMLVKRLYPNMREKPAGEVEAFIRELASEDIDPSIGATQQSVTSPGVAWGKV